MADRKRLLMGIGIGAGSVAALLAFAGLVTVYTGSYNVSATENHTAFGRWALDTTMHQSVERRAARITSPELTPAMLRAGAASYKTMCQHCHAGPGVSRATWAQGMLPRPPHLTEAATEWDANEIFWIVKNGVKMSGMPAFGESHDEPALWNIVAFVKALPAMPPEQYSALGQTGHHGSTGGTGGTGAAKAPSGE